MQRGSTGRPGGVVEAVDVQDLALGSHDQGVGPLAGRRALALVAGGKEDAPAEEGLEELRPHLELPEEPPRRVAVLAHEGEYGVVLLVEHLAAGLQDIPYVGRRVQLGHLVQAQAQDVGVAVHPHGVPAGEDVDLVLGVEGLQQAHGGADAGLLGGVAAGADEDGGGLVAAGAQTDQRRSVRGVPEHLRRVPLLFHPLQQMSITVENLHFLSPSLV